MCPIPFWRLRLKSCKGAVWWRGSGLTIFRLIRNIVCPRGEGACNLFFSVFVGGLLRNMSKGIDLFARDAAFARGDMPDAPPFRIKGGTSFFHGGGLCFEGVSGCFAVRIEGEL